jgi:hypothetical protein
VLWKAFIPLGSGVRRGPDKTAIRIVHRRVIRGRKSNFDGLVNLGDMHFRELSKRHF